MSSARSIRRKKELAERKALRKKAKQMESQVSNAVASMPKTCDECDAVFDKTNNDMLDQWRIAVYDDGRVHLVCPNCVPEEVKNVG